MTTFIRISRVTAAFLLGATALRSAETGAPPDAASATGAGAWTVGLPIVTYWAGPPLTDAVARQMAEGGFNLAWCGEKQLDVAQRHGLRGLLQDGLLTPATLDDPARRAELDALIDRVRRHPAMYSYFLTDEPSAGAFAAWGRLVAHLRERDPAHLAYINLFPTYANNEQLGTTGDTETAYRKHLQLYREVVKPALISYDHYQYAVSGETDQYFLNLAMIRDAAQSAGVPFLNIVQACTWSPAMRVPTTNEMRYLVYTTAAYGAQGISYYVYCHPGHTGGIALPDGSPTPIYRALKTLNREFVAMARELQPLRSVGVWHTVRRGPGCELLPAGAPFQIEAAAGEKPARGLLLGCFGRADAISHAVVVNLNATEEAAATLKGPAELECLDTASGRWSAAGGSTLNLHLSPGGGRLVRVKEPRSAP